MFFFGGNEMHKLLSAWLVLHTLFLMIIALALQVTVVFNSSESAKQHTPPLRGFKSSEKGKFVILALLNFFAASPEPEEWAEQQSQSPE